jgi:chromosome segregation ATPase
VSFFVFSPHRFLLLLLPVTAAVVIECEFYTVGWSVVGSIYTCYLLFDQSITSAGVTVTSATGNHMRSMSHADVKGFYSSSKTIIFMPRGLNDVFPNLIGIIISRAGMKELHQSDLKQFPRLRYLELSNNALTVIERELFKFNPELEYISLADNQINQIYPTVFDHLNKLSRLLLRSNLCIDANATDRSAVVNLLSSVKQECRGDTIIIDDDLQTSKQFSSLKAELTEATSKVAALSTTLKTLQQSESVQQTKLKTVKTNLENLQRTQEDEVRKLREDLNAVLSMAKELKLEHESALLTMQKQGEEINTLKLKVQDQSEEINALKAETDKKDAETAKKVAALEAENEVLKAAKAAVDGLKAEVEGLKVKVNASESDRKGCCNKLTALVAQETDTREANVTAVVDMYKTIKADHDTAVKAIDEKNTKIENNKLRLELVQSKLELKDEKFENLGRKVDGQGEKIEDMRRKLGERSKEAEEFERRSRRFDEVMTEFAAIKAQYDRLYEFLKNMEV